MKKILALIIFIFPTVSKAETWACEVLDTETNQCLEWVQITFLGLPELSPEQVGMFVGAYVLFLATIAGYRGLRPIVK